MRNSSNPTKRRRLRALDFVPEAVTTNYLLKLGWLVKGRSHARFCAAFPCVLKKTIGRKAQSRPPLEGLGVSLTVSTVNRYGETDNALSGASH